MKCISGAGNGMIAGIMDEKDMSSLTGSTAGLGFTTNSIGYYNTGIKYIADANFSYGASFTDNDIIGIALDMTSSTKTVTFYKNGASQGAINLSTTGAGTVFVGSACSNGTTSMNFGEGFFGTTAAGTNADGNGQGLFAYAVPSGYYAMNTKNLEAYG